MSVLTPIITQTVKDCINVSDRKIATRNKRILRLECAERLRSFVSISSLLHCHSLRLRRIKTSLRMVPCMRDATLSRDQGCTVESRVGRYDARSI